MQVNWIDIKYIGGPVSLALLMPSEKFPFKNKHPLLLLGDHHQCRQNMCDHKRLARHKKDSEVIVHTNVPLWFRLLDSYGTQHYPVQYFLESYFEPSLLIDPYYNLPEISKWISNSSTLSFMNYIIKFHPTCLMPNKSECITTNIQYEFADLRLNSKYYNMQKSDRHLYQALEYLESNNIKLEKTDFKDGTEVIKKLAKAIENRKKSPDTDEAEQIIKTKDSFGLPFYENQLSHYLTYFLGMNRINLNLNDLENKFNFRGIQLYELIRDKEYKKCAKLLFNTKSKFFITQSKLYKIAKELDLNLCQSIFIEYVEFCLSDSFQDKTKPRKLLENNVSFRYDQQTQHIERYVYLIHMTSSGNNRYLDEYTKELNTFNMYEYDAYDSIATMMESIIMAPFNDLYMLFTSLKNNAPLTVYNAGNDHIVYLYTYLKSKGYFITSPLFGWNSLQNSSLKNHKHCVTIDGELNLDEIVQFYMKSKEQQDKLRLNILRRDALGPDMLLRMLKGHSLSKEEMLKNKYIIDFMDEHHLESFDQLVNKLQLRFINQLVPNEYIKQASNYN